MCSGEVHPLLVFVRRLECDNPVYSEMASYHQNQVLKFGDFWHLPHRMDLDISYNIKLMRKLLLSPPDDLRRHTATNDSTAEQSFLLPRPESYFD